MSTVILETGSLISGQSKAGSGVLSLDRLPLSLITTEKKDRITSSDTRSQSDPSALATGGYKGTTMTGQDYLSVLGACRGQPKHCNNAARMQSDEAAFDSTVKNKSFTCLEDETDTIQAPASIHLLKAPLSNTTFSSFKTSYDNDGSGEKMRTNTPDGTKRLPPIDSFSPLMSKDDRVTPTSLDAPFTPDTTNVDSVTADTRTSVTYVLQKQALLCTMKHTLSEGIGGSFREHAQKSVQDHDRRASTGNALCVGVDTQLECQQYSPESVNRLQIDTKLNTPPSDTALSHATTATIASSSVPMPRGFELGTESHATLTKTFTPSVACSRELFDSESRSISVLSSAILKAPPGSVLAPNMESRLRRESSNQNPVSKQQSRKSQPILYSAIGSLEQYDQQNLGSLNDKISLVRGGGACKKAPKLSVRNNRGSVIERPADGAQRLHIGSEVQIDHSPLSNKEKDDGVAKTILFDKSLDGGGKRQGNVGIDEGNIQSSAKSPLEACATGKVESLNLDEQHHARIERRKSRNKKRVSINSKVKEIPAQPVEIFRPSCDAYTPRMERKVIEYKPAEMRTPMQKMSSTMGTIQRPNFRDALRRVSMIIQQHIVKIERRFEAGLGELTTLFSSSMRKAFSEESFVTPRFKCSIVKMPMARPGVLYGLRKINVEYTIPTSTEIYDFGHQLFKSVQLSSECSIVCLIYVERLMEIAKVPLLADTWRPIVMCGLLLASKVWQDLSSWNIEFASVYPQFSLNAINRMELQFLRMVKWDLYISSSLYAKYFFALRSLLEKQDFRHRYNRMVGGVGGVTALEALKIQKRTEVMKEEAINQLSKSM